MVAGKRQELASYPLRMVFTPISGDMQPVPQRGRLCEHWQLNVDISLHKDQKLEHEIIPTG